MSRNRFVANLDLHKDSIFASVIKENGEKNDA